MTSTTLRISLAMGLLSALAACGDDKESAAITDIADGLHLSVKTVSTHKTRILQKMNMASTAELVRYAVENKLVDAGV